ncbi:NEW3 domain-containing protein [Pyxidicoccus xibeiensis]|uniref:NEW3 domain-containing protein n=1 Tax=Pyxidicoccus xibeiensis TaxID=2906759 RepID=UPI0020A7EB96|nr:NEW3 domain-containing protein [Pyxidicoccus xibeiensis]MCP3135927.1 NEW3 domain-containing protein [Pyxidicoccus xibeiensis]
MLRTLLVLAVAVAAGCVTQEEPAPTAPAPTPTDSRVHTRPDAAPLKEKVSQLNTRLRRGEARHVTPLLAERASALAALMDVDAGAALALALPDAVRGSLARKHPGAATHLEERGTFEGELEAIVVDSPGRTEVRTDYFVRVKGERLQVRFADEASRELRSGLHVRVRGLKLGARVAAEDAEVVPVTSALSATSACSSTGDQRTIVILATFPFQPQTLTQEQVREVFFSTTQRSLTRFWSEASQGRTTASGDVVGWYTLDRAYSCNETDAMRTAALAAANADVDFRQYDRIFIVHPEATGTNCYYGGLGTLACNTQPTPDGTITASTSWLRAEYMAPNDMGVELVTHEGGHNLTLHHANTRDFGAEPLGPVGAAGTRIEYGDVFSTMGDWNLGHYSAPHKVRLGWLEPAALATVDGTDGTFTLSPISGPLGSGLQALKVRRGFHGDGWLWVEARRPVGDYDVTLPEQVFGGAVIHYEDASTGTATHLLDFTPETASWRDPAFLPGSTWTDPYTNVRLTVDASTAAGVTVSVQYAPVPCVSASPTVAFDTWYDYSTPGGQVESGVTVTNNDTVGCAASTFDLATSLPSGWPTSNLPASITLAPGKQRFFYFTKHVPEGTPYATYTVDLTVTRGSESITVDDTLDVIAPCARQPIQVYFDRGSQVVTAGDTAAFGVTVINRDSRACGWGYFEPASTLPAGWTTEYDQFGFDVEAGGSFEFTMYKAVPADAQGTYAVDVQLLREGYEVEATATASVEVNPCVRAVPTFTALPATVDVQPGGSVTYTLTLTNHDAATCGASTYDLVVETEPWGGVLSTPALTVEPGATATATLTVTAPVNAGAGSRFFELSVLRGGVYVHGAELEARIACLPRVPTVAFSPAVSTVEAGKPFTVTMTVGNADNRACDTGSFAVGATVPSGWTYAFSQSVLSLAPGASGTVSLTVTPPVTATAGRYTPSAVAAHAGLSTTGTFAVDVTPPPLKATVSVPASTYKRNALVPLTTTVMRGTLSAQASVRFTVTRPDGLAETRTVATDSMGKAAWSYTARVRGTHQVTATATAGTETATSNTVGFSVL